MRPEWSQTGLLTMISYINEIIPTENLTLIEIGSYAGESTNIFCKNFKSVISIDPYMENYDINDPACHNMKLGEVYNIFVNNTEHLSNHIHIKKISDNAVIDLVGNQIDVVYIDGLHTYNQVKMDILNYIPIIQKGGYISGHDYHPNWPGVMQAVHEVLGNPDKIFSDTSWIKRIE